tara:strand:- start:1127 stop:8572 length:7446 start_codon:yes stop_codon:yes gene_type:complete
MEKLYNSLSEQGKYTKSFDDFQTQFGSVEGQEKLYGALEKAGDYTKSFEDFSNQFFSGDSVKTNDSASADPAVESSKNDSDSNSANNFSASPIEKNTWLEDWVGEKEDEENTLFGFVDFVSDTYRAAKSGGAVGLSVDESFDLYKSKDGMSEEDAKALIEAGRRIEQFGPSKEQIDASQQMQKLKKEGYSDMGAFMSAYWDNPSALSSTMASSLSMMAASFFDSDEVQGSAAAGSGAGALAGAAGGAGVGVFFAGVGAAPGAVIGAKIGAVSGFMSGITAAMETGLTTAQLLEEAAVETGVEWGSMNDKQRMDFVMDLTRDKERFGDMRSKALARGLTIGGVDFAVNMATLGVGKLVSGAVSKTAISALTKPITGAAVATTESVGAGVGEYLGQKAAGQEYNFEEIALEALADKQMTVLSGVKNINKGNPSYNINGQKMNGKEFSETLKIMDDAAIVKADIKIEDSPSVQKIVDNRRGNIAADQRVDSRISDVADRAEAIRLTKEKNKLEGNKEGNKTKLTQINGELEVISNKYADSEVDATIQERQDAVAQAADTKFETEFNKNFKAAVDAKEVTGQEPILFEDDNSYLDAVEEIFGVEGRKKAQSSNGVFAGNGKVFINKAQAKRSINIATGNIGAISVASHEVLHPIFNALIGGAKTQGQFVKQFQTRMTGKQKTYVKSELKKRGYNRDATAIELMNIFSDGIIKNEINYDRTLFEKLGDSIVKLFNSQGFDKLSFDNGQEVYNFLKEYNTSIKAGKLSDKAISTIKEAEAKKGVKVADAKLLTTEQFSQSILDAEQALEDAQNGDPNDPRYFDNLDKAEAALDLAEEQASNPQAAQEVKKEDKPKPKPKVNRPEKPTRTTDLGPRDPKSKKIMDTYNEGMEGVERSEYKANKPLPASLERKLVPLFEGYINTIVQQKFKQFSTEALEFQDALSILRAEVVSAIRTFNPKVNKDLAGYVKRYGVQARQSLMFKDANTEFTSDLDDAKGVTSTDDVQTIDRSGTVERGQATFDELDIVDDTLIEEIKEDIEKEIRVRTQKGTLSEMIEVKKGRDTYMVTWLENYVNKQLFKKLSKKLGAITGVYPNAVIPGAYIDFLNDPKTFDIITKALPIKSIKKSYGKLFPMERVGREVTAEGNPVFKIGKIDKRAFLTYFVKGKKSAVLERQKQLFREILEPIAKQVVADYATPENIAALEGIKDLAPAASMDIVESIVIDAQLKNLESQLDRYKGEQKTFDIIQFSQNEVVNPPNVTNELLSIAGLDSKETLLKDSAQGKQTFYLDKLKGYYKTREELMDFLPPFITKYRTLSAGMLGFVYREDGSYYDFFQHDYKKAVNKKGEKVTDQKELNSLYERGTAAFRNNILDSKADTSKYSDDTKILIKEVQDLIEKADLGNLVPNLHAGRIKTAKAILKPTVNLKTAVGVLNHLGKNNDLNTKIAELYISLLRDFVKSSKNKKKAKMAIVNMLLATGNTVNGWRSLAAISSIIYNKNKSTDYYFEHNDSMRSVLPNILSQILSDGPISFKVDASLIPRSLATTKNKTKATKIGNKAVTDAFYKETLKGNKDLRIVQLSKSTNSKDPFGMIDVVSSRLFNTDYAKLTVKQQKRVDLEMQEHKLIQFSKTLNKAKAMINRPDAPQKGISVWDFDDTLATTKSNVLYTLPDGTKGKINATEFALQADQLTTKGAEFDFSEFSKVMQGAKGPMFDKAIARNKKFGNSNVYILTARPANSKYAIHEFLKGIGLDIKLENIFGLGDGTAIAKAKWVVGKVAEGYNDFYFADDAYKNVKAVQEVLEQADVKSKVHQAQIQFSKNLNEDFNNIMEDATGIDSKKTISDAKGKVLGKKKGRFKFFIPPSAEDFAGLLYRLTGKGTKGEAQQAWFKKSLFDPFAKAMRDFESYKQNVSGIVKQLKKQIKNVPNGLKKINSTGFTNETAVRVYLWVKNGYDIPGLDKTDLQELVDIVNNDATLKDFADQMDAVLEGFPEPQGDWLAGNITTDAINMVNTTKRAEFLEAWQANADTIFSKENLNKLRAAFGDNYVEAMQDMLYRMKTGRNRPSGSNKLTNRFMNWVNDSVGTIMFFNTRSALLQTLSIVNFINWGDNNPIAAAKAFANQKQFWADFTMLFNSDFLKQRRSGLKNDINADDIANAAETATNKTKAVLSSMLKMGFLPTQIADSFAIAMGGASFIRNRINAYVAEGMSKQEASEKAFLEFQEIAEETQQSSRPDRVSQQQASPLGRIVLAFANTPMQYMRLTKKAFLDLKNGRGSAKANITKIMYYSLVQNIIFSSLQAALFAALFDDDDDVLEDKQGRVANSMLDSILRGVGVYGAIASTLKNIVMEVNNQNTKSRPDYTVAAQRALSISPPLDSKMRKIMSAARAFSYKTTREKMTGYGLDNPAYYAVGQIISAGLNIPVDRAIRKADNLRVAVDNDTKYWQSLALFLGYSQWDVGLIETSKNKKKRGFGKTKSWNKRFKVKRGSWKK